MKDSSGVKIVVAGGGFAGVRASLELVKRLPHSQITLINKTAHHCYFPDLYEVASAKLRNEKPISIENLKGTVSLSLEDVFRDTDVSILIDEIKEVDPTKKTLTTKSQILDFDYLVLSLGSLTNFFGIEGAVKYAHTLKSCEDAINLRNDLKALTQEKPDAAIVIAGGGFTGIELAAELRYFLPKQTQVVIVEGLESVLTGMPTWSQKETKGRLSKLGVKVLTSHIISKIERTKIICKNGESLEYDYLVWTTGITGNNLNGQIKGVELTKRGQIEVLPTLNLAKFPNVFIIGDLAQFQDPIKGNFVPPTAWAAIGEAEIAAKNIKAIITDGTLRNYVPPFPTFVVPVGGRFALTSLFGLEMTGIIVWMLKQLITLHYLITTLPFFKAIKTWWQGVIIFSRNDQKS